MTKTQFNTASTLAETTGVTARNAYFGAIDAGNEALLADILKRHADAVAWREYRDDTHMADDYGLHVAARKGHIGIAKMLVAAGAGVNVRDCEGSSPLTAAIVAGREDMVRYLLTEAKADPNHRDAGFETPLMTAAAEGMQMAVELLLDAGANVHVSRAFGNALFDAALSSKPSEAIFNALLRRGINHDATNGDCKTVFEVMREHGHGGARLDMLAKCIVESFNFRAAQEKLALERDIEGIHEGVARNVSVRTLKLKRGP